MRLTKQLTLIFALSVSLAGAVHWIGLETSGSRVAFAMAWVSHADHTWLRTVSVKELPSEARRALKLIKEGGPFPYAKDGITFHNREGRLPGRPAGYYKEYTVMTPGIRGRGPRRIVTGSRGEFYYTDDHYRTFKRIVE
jgi:ribonuclease T1